MRFLHCHAEINCTYLGLSFWISFPIPPFPVPLVAGIDVQPDPAAVVPLSTEGPPPHLIVPAAVISLNIDADRRIAATVAGRSPYVDLDAVVSGGLEKLGYELEEPKFQPAQEPEDFVSSIINSCLQPATHSISFLMTLTSDLEKERNPPPVLSWSSLTLTFTFTSLLPTRGTSSAALVAISINHRKTHAF